MAGILGSTGAPASLAMQSIQLLERIHMASAKKIAEKVYNNPALESNELAECMNDLLDIAKQIDGLMTKLEALHKDGKGFGLFVHDFVKGPTEQKRLEKLRSERAASKNTLTLTIVAGLAPAGTTLTITNVKLSDRAFAEHSRIIRTKDDKDWDHVTVKNTRMSGDSKMITSPLTPSQHDKLNNDVDRNERLKLLSDIVKCPGVEAPFKKDMFEIIGKLASSKH
ncbi:hypothetical protein F5Y15DRAFT_411956 [Xylariaceae sp. FL0016]|nr:hypothetical protein F5Y15DRAFT_411956 [Xylariaceae sp. FL0016]